MWVWVAPLTLSGLLLLLLALVEAMMVTMVVAQVNCIGLCAFTLVTGFLTIPLQRCVTVSTSAIVFMIMCLCMHLQYASALALVMIGRPWSVILCGIPNVLLVCYLLLILVLHTPLGMTGLFAARQSTWYAFTVLAPACLVPQTFVLLMWYPLTKGVAWCVKGYLVI